MRRVLIVFVLMLMTVSIASAKTEMICQPDTVQVEVGDTVTFDVVVKPDQEMDTVSIDKMAWDPNILEFVDVEQGDIFENSLVWIKGTANYGNYTWLCWGCNVPTSSEGVLVHFTFKGIANGTSSINLEEVGVARAGEMMNVTTEGISVVVGSGSYTPMVTIPDIPIFLVLSIILIIIVCAVTIVVKIRGRKPK